MKPKSKAKKIWIIVLVIIVLIGGSIAVFMAPTVGGMTVLFAFFSVLIYRKMAIKQFGGVTGDTSGFFLQICELACLAGAWIGVHLV